MHAGLRGTCRRGLSLSDRLRLPHVLHVGAPGEPGAEELIGHVDRLRRIGAAVPRDVPAAVRLRAAGELRVGGAVRRGQRVGRLTADHRDVVRQPRVGEQRVVREQLPLRPQLVREIGHLRVRAECVVVARAGEGDHEDVLDPPGLRRLGLRSLRRRRKGRRRAHRDRRRRDRRAGALRRRRRGAAAGAGAAGALDWFPPRAASAARSCEANPLSPPLASVLPTIRAVATLDEAMIRRKRVAVTLPAVSITQRRARVIVVYSFASWLPQREQNRAPGS